MSVPAETPSSRAPARRPAARLAAAALALLVATPLAATVWTRSNVQVRIPKGSRAELENVSYTGRDWSVALTALEVKEEGRAVADQVSVSWLFRYTNTDKEPHFVSVTVRCLDMQRNERTRFVAKAVLQAGRPDGATVEVRAKVREADWKQSAFARIVVDFLSTPDG